MPDQAENSIRDAIAEQGRITFAEFMRLALYGPGGYYTTGSPISAAGDYITAPATHPAFGALIAVQLREMWHLLESPTTFTVVEEAAGNGGLAADITEYAARLDEDFASVLDYIALDIAPPASQHYQVAPLDQRPSGITGCLLSNELLDAMPVHRFEIRDGSIQEIFVGLQEGQFVEILDAPSIPEITKRVQTFLPLLPDGYRGEVNTGLAKWASLQAETLNAGWLIAIDYGFDRKTLYKPERVAGSLRTYKQHTLGVYPFRNIGRQDLTAHVDFSAVDESLTETGFVHGGTVKLVDFLQNLGLTTLMQAPEHTGAPRATRRVEETRLRSLVNPSGIGAFLVASCSRNAPQKSLTGVAGTQGHPSSLPYAGLAISGRHFEMYGAQPHAGHFEVPSFEDLFSDEP
jgi:SAM-dependent MidA family methyltransferase